jgi:hypothetical protein
MNSQNSIYVSRCFGQQASDVPTSECAEGIGALKLTTYETLGFILLVVSINQLFDVDPDIARSML